MAQCLLGLGSNLGDRGQNLHAALARLDQLPHVRVTRASSFFGSHPAGGPDDQPEFLNTCAIVETSLAPTELLAAVQTIENELGRVRTVRWGPRTIDIDLLLFAGAEATSLPNLMLPHPRMAVRRFVLLPAAEIAPDWIFLENGWSLAQLLKNLNESPRSLAVVGSDRALVQRVIDGLHTQLANWQVVEATQQPRFRIALDPEQSSNSTKSAGGPPTLWIRSADESQIVAEVLAACQASE